MKLKKLEFLKKFKENYFNHLILFDIYFCTKYNKLKNNKNNLLIKTSMGTETIYNIPTVLFIEGFLKKNITLKTNPYFYLRSKKLIYFNYIFFFNNIKKKNKLLLLKSLSLFVV